MELFNDAAKFTRWIVKAQALREPFILVDVGVLSLPRAHRSMRSGRQRLDQEVRRRVDRVRMNELQVECVAFRHYAERDHVEAIRVTEAVEKYRSPKRMREVENQAGQEKLRTGEGHRLRRSRILRSSSADHRCADRRG
jgi:hypothetical protein